MWATNDRTRSRIVCVSVCVSQWMWTMPNTLCTLIWSNCVDVCVHIATRFERGKGAEFNTLPLSPWWSVVTKLVFCASFRTSLSCRMPRPYQDCPKWLILSVRPEQCDKSQVKWTVLLTMKFESVGIWHSHICQGRQQQQQQQQSMKMARRKKYW